MAFSTASLGREKKITTLADRLFVIKGPDRAKTLKNVERELIKANPQLAQPEGFKQGTVIVIPGHLGLEKTERVISPMPDLGGTLDQTLMQTKLAMQTMEKAFDASARETKIKQARLSSADFTGKLAKQWPESGKVVPTTLKNLSQRTEEEQAVRARFTAAFEQAEVEIERLKAMTKRDV